MTVAIKSQILSTGATSKKRSDIGDGGNGGDTGAGGGLEDTSGERAKSELVGKGGVRGLGDISGVSGRNGGGAGERTKWDLLITRGTGTTAGVT